MAIPTITAITPSIGPAHGRTAVVITGTGFHLYADPPVSGPVPVPPHDPVLVTFGGQPARKVEVYSATELMAIPPGGKAGAVDVVVSNIDQTTGAVLGSGTEHVTAAGGYTYALPKIRAEDSAKNESDLTRLVRTLLQLFKGQVTPEVMTTPNTDWTDGSTPEMRIAKMPALVLAGPSTTENRLFSTNELQKRTVGDRVFQALPPKTVDLLFNLMAVSDNEGELINLHSALMTVLNANPYIYMDRDPTDASKGQVRWELIQRGELNAPSYPNTSNIRSWSLQLVILGFDIEGLVEYPADLIAQAGAADTVDNDPELTYGGLT